MRRYLHMKRVGFEDARVSSLGFPRPLCEVTYLFSCLLDDLNEQC